MSNVWSPVKKIDDLHFEQFPKGRVMSPERIVRRDGVTVMTMKTGFKIYCDSLKDHVSYAPGGWPWTNGLMKCLFQLKIITKEQMNQHLSRCKEADEKSDKEYKLEYFKRAAEKYGFDLTEEQLVALNGLPCDACGKPITSGDDNVGIDCNLHKKCAAELKSQSREDTPCQS